MIQKSMKIQLSTGLEARPVAVLVQKASQYDSTVYIQAEGKKVNAKSIMGMMSLPLSEGISLTVVADGVDEVDAVNGVETFLTTVK